jgi:8-oxo-dGTP pyrophosphatase MutT (NUDIX family)
VASKAEDWRRQLRRRLAEPQAPADSSETLRRRILGSPSPEFIAWLDQPSRAAAVLLGLVERPGGPRILLTERAVHLLHHPGQISLPGGRLHPGESPEQGALREAEEEVALGSSQVEVLGQLAPLRTGTGFIVTPVVGWIDAGFEARPDPSEVQVAFEVPLAHLLVPENRRRSVRLRWNTEFLTDEFLYQRFLIWGATAEILSQLIEIINDKSIG